MDERVNREKVWKMKMGKWTDRCMNRHVFVWAAD